MSFPLFYGINRDRNHHQGHDKVLKADCYYFRGEKPCRFKRLCEGCPHYTPFPFRILIIKGRAQGDVLRTTAILSGLKRKYSPSHITWLVDEESLDLLKYNPLLERVMVYSIQNVIPLLEEKFDLLLSLDKESPSIGLATQVKADRKLGFGMNQFGNLILFNEEASYAYQLGVDDDLKFYKNKKTYQEIIYEIAGLEYKNDGYIFNLKENNMKKAEQFFVDYNISKEKKCIGLNTGAGEKFLTKQWPPDYFLYLIKLLQENLQPNIFLLGGPREKDINSWLEEKAGGIYNTGNNNFLLDFAGFLDKMDLVVCSDTLALHLAIALNKTVVAFFGSTCSQEIDLYGNGVKLYEKVDCSPCYKKNCPDMTCMKAITPKKVMSAIKSLLL